MAGSVNAAARALTGIEFTEDEEVWRKEKRLQGPFVVVALASKQQFEAVDPPIDRREEGHAITYQEFSAAKSELSALRMRALPQLQFSISSQLSLATANPVNLKKVESAHLGRTATGLAISDVQLTMNGQATIATNRKTASLQVWIDRAVKAAPKFRQKSVRPFSAALEERDQFKRFLYFFLSLEIETHAVFSALKTDRGVDRLMTSDGALHRHAAELLRRQAKGLVNLADRFVWCALCKWPAIKEDDIETFHRLKKARDDIAHGNTQEPPAGYAFEAQRLALKVLAGGQ